MTFASPLLFYYLKTSMQDLTCASSAAGARHNLTFIAVITLSSCYNLVTMRHSSISTTSSVSTKHIGSLTFIIDITGKRSTMTIALHCRNAIWIVQNVWVVSVLFNPRCEEEFTKISRKMQQMTLVVGKAKDL